MSAATTLVTALGGNSDVLAIYDGLTTSSVTTSSGLVTTWADARGGGFGPSLTAASGHRPSFTSGTGAVTFNGTNASLFNSTASSVFALNQAYSIALVISASGASNAAGLWASIADSVSFNRALCVGPNIAGTGNTVYAGYSGTGTAYEADSTLAFNSSNIYLVIVSQDASFVYMNAVALTQVKTANGGLQASGSNHLTLGNDYETTTGAYLAGVIYGVVCIPRVVTSTDISNLQTYASAYGYTVAGGGGTNYSLSCASGAFSITGGAAAAAYGRKVSADAGAYAITGESATLNKGYILNADAGEFLISDSLAVSIPGGDQSSGAAAAAYIAANYPALTAIMPSPNEIVSFALTPTVTSPWCAGVFLRSAGPTSGASYFLGISNGPSAGTSAGAPFSSMYASGCSIQVSTDGVHWTTLASGPLPAGVNMSTAGSFTIQGAAVGHTLVLSVNGIAALQVTDSTLAAAGYISIAYYVDAFPVLWTSMSASWGGGGTAQLLYDRVLYADDGTFAETGRAATLAYGHQLVADAGAYALTGESAGLYRGYPLLAGTGVYALAGGASSLLFDRILPADAGDFALTGNAAFLQAGYTMVAAAGAFSLGGENAGLAYGRALSAGAGALALAGGAASLLRTYVLSADSGAFALAGESASLLRAYLLPAASGDFLLTGPAGSLTFARVLAADAGAFSLTGEAAALTLGYTMTASAGAFALEGNSAAQVFNRRLSAAAGAFAIAGQNAVLAHGRVLAAQAGAYALSGQAATVRYGRGIQADAGAFSVSGQPSDLRWNHILLAASGAFAQTGNAADLSQGYTLPAGAGAYAVNGRPAALLYLSVLGPVDVTRVLACPAIIVTRVTALPTLVADRVAASPTLIVTRGETVP